jgi:hypothetical protein
MLVRIDDIARELLYIAALPPGVTRDMMPADWCPPPLPHGITIRVDWVADIIIVANDDLGFCITRNAIDDNIHLPIFRTGLERLIEVLSDPAEMSRLKETPFPAISGEIA